MTDIEKLTAELRRTNALLVLMDARLGRIERALAPPPLYKVRRNGVLTRVTSPGQIVPRVIPIRMGFPDGGGAG